MSDVFSGLESMGFVSLEDIELYGDEKEPAAKVEPKKEEPKVKQESDSEVSYIFDKTFECPCCGKNFKAKTVKVGRARLVGSDRDLRPLYSGIDAAKYDILFCNYCGYAAMTRFFGHLTPNQIKTIRENITAKYKPTTFEGDIYTYEDAVSRYKMALLNSVIKHSKASEKAYTCLKLAWIYRGMREELPDNDRNSAMIKEYRSKEHEMLLNAYKGLSESRAKEDFPICGMDAITFDYLLACLAFESEDYEISMKLLSNVITSRVAKERLKEKARELRNIIKEKIGGGNK